MAQITSAKVSPMKNPFGLIEEFRDVLHKKVDLLRLEDILDNKELLMEILRDGVKLYG